MPEVVKIECPHCSQRIALPEGFNQPSATCPVCKGGIELEFDENAPASNGAMQSPVEESNITESLPNESHVDESQVTAPQTEEREAVATKPSLTVAPPSGEMIGDDGQIVYGNGDRGPCVENSNWFKTLFSFKGRIRRTNYWITSLVQTVFMGILLGIMILLSFAAIMGADAEGNPNGLLAALGQVIFFIGMIPLMWISFATVGKRFHDREKSAWWSLLMLTGIGFIWIFIECGCLDGTRGPNRFGFDPKAT